MDEDDLDFTPNQSTSSNLGSLFGFIKKPLQGNSALTYTAPKAPKKESSPSKNQPTDDKRAKEKIIWHKPVQAYKLENGKYVNQGLTGIVISGNYESHTYAIILYKASKEHLSKTKITRLFSLTVSPNNYISFYDSNNQNWSILFQSPVDVEEFVEKVAISKFYCQVDPPESILVQDVTPSSNVKSYPNSTVEVTYNTFSLDEQSVNSIQENVKTKINLSESTSPLAKGLVGCSESSKRVIIVPNSLSGMTNDLGTDKDLLYRVKIEKILSELERSLMNSKGVEDGAESPLDSSTEETSIKAREASLKQVLAASKSHKANLISRMARMGQPTLPLKQGLSGGPSDSEEDSVVTSSPKARISRNKAASHQNSNSMGSHNSVQDSTKQLLVYQNDATWQHAQMKYGMPQQQVIPVSASPVLSPTADPNLPIYISESRIQAAELRMSISKISEKVDVVINKVQNIASDSEVKRHPAVTMDSSGILSSIQNLIAENENLKTTVESQKKKLEQQNDRIFNLLELNHKYLEQNSNSLEKKSETELSLRKEMESGAKKKLELEADNKRYLEKFKFLEEQLEKSEEARKRLKETTVQLTGELNNCRRDMEGNNSMKSAMESYEERMSKASEINARLKEMLKELKAEKETLRAVVETQKESLEANSVEIKELKRQNQAHETMVERLKGQIVDVTSKSDSLTKNLKKLEEEKENLTLQSGEERGPKGGQGRELDKELSRLLHKLNESFDEGTQYAKAEILHIVEKCFNDGKSIIECRKRVDGDGSQVKTEVQSHAAVHEVGPGTRGPDGSGNVKKSENVENSAAEAGDGAGGGEGGISGADMGSIASKTDKSDSRYNSYDQGWRTTKPPPPSLFDDEDEEDDWLN